MPKEIDGKLLNSYRGLSLLRERELGVKAYILMVDSMGGIH